MTKKMWDTYAPICERAMWSDKRIYQFMYERIPEVIRNKDVPDHFGKEMAARITLMYAERAGKTDTQEGRRPDDDP